VFHVSPTINQNWKVKPKKIQGAALEASQAEIDATPVLLLSEVPLSDVSMESCCLRQRMLLMKSDFVLSVCAAAKASGLFSSALNTEEAICLNRRRFAFGVRAVLPSF
jgi:hypothetical protein